VVIAVVGVILQGILGGLRVSMMKGSNRPSFTRVSRRAVSRAAWFHRAGDDEILAVPRKDGTHAVEGGAPATLGLDYPMQMPGSPELAPPS